MEITRPNQVWAMDITYIPMARGFVYLAVVLDWATRRVLSWRLSITMEAAFCVETLEEALARHGRPEIFNTDQGSQFTGAAFTGVLADNGVAISMDGRGAWRDNVFVERLWRSVKYEEVYLRGYDSVSEARASIGRYLDFYNGRRPHSSLDGATPDQAYFTTLPLRWQPNLGRGSTYRCGKSVQTTGPSSVRSAICSCRLSCDLYAAARFRRASITVACGCDLSAIISEQPKTLTLICAPKLTHDWYSSGP